MEVMLDRPALDALMPMSLLADARGHILHAGPTLAKMRPEGYFAGQDLFGLFRFKRPRDIAAMAALRAAAGTPLRLCLLDDPQSQLRGAVVPWGGPAGGALLNLSFGLHVFQAIRHYTLNAGDFAVTDPTMDMLYLVEAKSAAMDVSHDLNLRLQAARIAAEEQAFTDTLTGLKNRRALDLVLGRYRRQGTDFALMGIDLDYFKRVNDTMGHGAGDMVLQHVARLMLARSGEGDTLVRTGGDEFLIVLRDRTDLEALRPRAEDMIRALEAPIAVPGGSCGISASIGLCASTQFDLWDTPQILADVDAALYAAKNGGRSRVAVFVPGMAPSQKDPEAKGRRLLARTLPPEAGGSVTDPPLRR
ncbi:GGDEF domain-containing protein [Mangrovicoccus algicola]|uniref:diguanylate cyclase n=1 Tax=Mangrovicoccus algicola TaxID=2771008 RepID=A0A8J6Z8R3_9RHOB|nr:GGDEF domain-containing protein [Mangrovicoccus algicola]MBE3637931.1 GGDEF domain-containing protein [Mangrovicoccus algicola]